jgi:hypothetical protein
MPFLNNGKSFITSSSYASSVLKHVPTINILVTKDDTPAFSFAARYTEEKENRV